ncbi:hypothetical protein GCM10009716_33860 [Streptomyces sodiiphilus]|uniref:HTTM-like domain-containing protein n=1 Tax=Streptomyces sodiiphilus TaxID=226217 RepID=A0ABN2PK94_9ACTN
MTIPPQRPPAPGAPGTPGTEAPPATGGPGPYGPGGEPPSPFRDLSGRFDRALGRGLGHITRRALGPHQTAVVRIGFALTWLVYLVRERPHRHELYGPDSPWGWDLAQRLLENNGAFTVLMWSEAVGWFSAVYLFSLAASVGMLLGWRTRTMSVFFMIGVLSLQNRSVFMGDGGDNVIHLMAMYLVFTRCAQVWSLDARRERRRAERSLPAWHDPAGIALWSAVGLVLLGLMVSGFADLPWTDRGPFPEYAWFPGIGWATVFWGLWAVHGLWWLLRRYAPGEPRAVASVLANLAHNAALLVIMAQVCIIYATAGWYKIQGSRWQDGTAVYYPLNLDYFAPWPEVATALAGSGLLVLVMSYGTVFVQVAFPFALLNRRAKNILLAIMIAEHVGIAVLLGLPFFSMAMIAMDIVFLPTAFLLWLGYRTRRLTDPLRRAAHRAVRRRPVPSGDSGREPPPARTPAAERGEGEEPGESPGAFGSGESGVPGQAARPGGQGRPAWADPS